jgi:hypothetical protein
MDCIKKRDKASSLYPGFLMKIVVNVRTHLFVQNVLFFLVWRQIGTVFTRNPGKEGKWLMDLNPP